MTVVPTGLPAHARASDITTFGGDLNKRNYRDVGVTDPLEDQSAEQFSRSCDTLQAVEKTAPFCVFSYSQLDDHDPIITFYKSQYGVAPTAVRVADGYASFTFASSYSDVYGVSSPFAISGVMAHPIGIQVTPQDTQWQLLNPQTVYIKLDNYSGTTAKAFVSVW